MIMTMEYTSHDALIRSGFTLSTKLGNVEFQFPPKVMSDERHGDWHEHAVRGVEPIAIYAGVRPRILNAIITYIVDGNYWNVKRITQQLHILRGYYLLPESKSDSWLVAKVQIWSIGGEEPMTCRLKATNVKYSETLVSSGNEVFPLRTTVSIDMALWSMGGGTSTEQKMLTGASIGGMFGGAAGAMAGAVAGGTEKSVNVTGLDPVIKPSWY